MTAERVSSDARQLETYGSPRTLGESGEVLVEIGAHSHKIGQDASSWHPGALAVIDPRTGKSQLIRAAEDVDRDMHTSDPAFDDEHVVWIDFTEGYKPRLPGWTLYAANRKTGHVTTVARADRDDGIASLTLNNGWVYWTRQRANPVTGKPPINVVYGKKLDSPERTAIIADDAAWPVAAGDWLYYLGDGEHPNNPEYAIYRKSLTTGATTLIHRGSRDRPHGQVGGLVAYGDMVVWVEGRDAGHDNPGDTVYVYAGDRKIAQIEAPEENLGSFSIGPTAVGFRDGSYAPASNYLLDLRTGCLHNLGDAPGLAEVMLAGRTIMWATSDGKEPHARQLWHYGTLR